MAGTPTAAGKRKVLLLLPRLVHLFDSFFIHSERDLDLLAVGSDPYPVFNYGWTIVVQGNHVFMLSFLI